MEELTYYSSFDELKNSDKSVEPNAMRAVERHKRFADAMRLLRDEYVQSKAIVASNTSVDKKTGRGL